MLDADIWTIIIYVYISLGVQVKSKKILKMFWLSRLQPRPWQTKEAISELCWQTSQPVSCFQLIVRYEFPKDCVHCEGSDLIFIWVISHMLLDATEDTFMQLIQPKTSRRTVSYQTKVLTV